MIYRHFRLLVDTQVTLQFIACEFTINDSLPVLGSLLQIVTVIVILKLFHHIFSTIYTFDYSSHLQPYNRLNLPLILHLDLLPAEFTFCSLESNAGITKTIKITDEWGHALIALTLSGLLFHTHHGLIVCMYTVTVIAYVWVTHMHYCVINVSRN